MSFTATPLADAPYAETVHAVELGDYGYRPDDHQDAHCVRSILTRAERDEEIDRNPIPLMVRCPICDQLTYLATKSGRVKPRRTRLLAPLARDLAEFRIRCGRPGDDELVFGEWSGDAWDNWCERIFQPAAVAVGLPDDTIPRDLRGSFASFVDVRGPHVFEVAAQLGHKPSTCLDIYGRLFEEFHPAQRRPAVEVIREARKAVRNGTVPTGYPAEPVTDDTRGRATAGNGE